MRMIDGDRLLRELTALSHGQVWPGWTYEGIRLLIERQPTLTPPNEWVSVEDELPKLPDRDWCAVMVNTAQKGNPKSRPMIYERAIVRGKRVERWKYYWDRIADELPDYWMNLPAPPDRRPPEGEEGDADRG